LVGSRAKKTNAGFSLIELIVVMGIFTIITSVIMFNYGRFSSNLVVTNLAYEAALAVRQAQVYGISVKRTNVDGSNFDAAYGVWFDKNDLQAFYLFADQPGTEARTNQFDVTLNETEESFGLNGSNIIDDFCVKESNGTKSCKSTGDIDSMSIVFKRPEPNAKIYGFPSIGVPIEFASQAEVIFTLGRGDKRARMTVTNTGQISIDSCNNPLTTNDCPLQ